MMRFEYTMAPVKATGPGIVTRTPTPMDLERQLRPLARDGWRLVQVLTLGLLFRQTWLVLERPLDEYPSTGDGTETKHNKAPAADAAPPGALTSPPSAQRS